MTVKHILILTCHSTMGWTPSNFKNTTQNPCGVAVNWCNKYPLPTQQCQADDTSAYVSLSQNHILYAHGWDKIYKWFKDQPSM